MKALPQSNPRQSRARHDARLRATAPARPPTDHHFQTATDELAATAEQLPAAVDAEERQAFRQIGSDYFGAKSHRGYFVEIATFLAVTGLSAWALVVLVILLAQTAQG